MLKAVEWNNLSCYFTYAFHVKIAVAIKLCVRI